VKAAGETIVRIIKRVSFTAGGGGQPFCPAGGRRKQKGRPPPGPAFTILRCPSPKLISPSHFWQKDAGKKEPGTFSAEK